MRFGFHISIAGGFKKVPARALAKECQTIQFFSRNPRGWNYSALDALDITEFQAQLKKTDISPIFVHMPYLPNLASPDKEIFKKSVESLTDELKRAEQIDAHFVVMHIGSRLSSSETQAIKRMADGINRALLKVKNRVILLLENTAGMGSEIGYTFLQISEIFNGLKQKDRVGIVIDTAHIFEAGYPIHTQDGLNQMIKELDRLVGIQKLHLIHLNDSKTDLNSKVDRHWHIGEGKIGIEAMKAIINHPLLKHLPAIMETPKKNDKDDTRNMRVVKSLVATTTKISEYLR